jgi:hypothetical protein
MKKKLYNFKKISEKYELSNKNLNIFTNPDYLNYAFKEMEGVKLSLVDGWKNFRNCITCLEENDEDAERIVEETLIPITNKYKYYIDLKGNLYFSKENDYLEKRKAISLGFEII